ncbi:hypothetical protein MF271_06275 [Deinococcus sp. KNUC1210]|nr:hypothetical protein [Deinococcus sp. KNUC1210]ULH16216.1 hypothetical protein MF271_06275 [Deinococcus sp. KNUC1210]
MTTFLNGTRYLMVTDLQLIPELTSKFFWRMLEQLLALEDPHLKSDR